ncbi:hypothetical protein FHX37_0772 [Haloactinospora alba]|uniref:Alkylation response protein AidB-like acyl-CoA dehydrogenase n=1 Tax=Haloactinospora alba TaxID=405555 RepID=A0A543NGF3_9ACTN|nr:acyl-CoA dehydrogenase family protein [Haloactinospora alba]TQN30884.1 hypothetical protein FHX37_0772 [Haloactinospora alba]
MSETTPDLLYTDVEEELRSSVRALLADKSPVSAVLGRVDEGGAAVVDSALWQELAGLGTTGLPLDEELGGSGATFREAAVVAEELGRGLAPVPYLGSAVMVTSALMSLGRDEAALLEALATGGSVAALAVGLATAPDAPFPTSVRAAADGTLSGTVEGVADAIAADRLLVPASGPEGPALCLVDAAETRRSAVVSLDMTRPLTDVDVSGASGRLVASGQRADTALRAALVNGCALLSAEQLGIAEWALETTVDYVGTRTQFGRPVGSFQALKHRLADLWVGVSQARAVVRNAADAVAAESSEVELNASLAQSFVSDVAVRATEEAVQLHGGIGFTWEHPLHLYLKRAKSDAIALGTPDRHRRVLSRLADIPS